MWRRLDDGSDRRHEWQWHQYHRRRDLPDLHSWSGNSPGGYRRQHGRGAMAQTDPQTIEAAPIPKLEVDCSGRFREWLAEQRISIAFTTYQSGKLFLIGRRHDGRLSVHERTFNRCMGLWASSQTLWMSSLYQLWRFENALASGETHQGYDRLYVPQTGYTTGDIDIHDIAVERSG